MRNQVLRMTKVVHQQHAERMIRRVVHHQLVEPLENIWAQNHLQAFRNYN